MKMNLPFNATYADCVRNLLIAKVEKEKLFFHPYANCTIYRFTNEQGDWCEIFVSYNTPVAMIDCYGWANVRDKYSVTTSRQVSWYFNDIPRRLNGQMDVRTVRRDCKQIVFNNMLTGEVHDYADFPLLEIFYRAIEKELKLGYTL